MSDQRTHRVAVIGGDGIGPEVTAAALEVVAAAGVDLDDDDLRPRRGALPARRLRASTTRRSRSCAASTPSCWAPSDPRSATPASPGGVLERGLLLADALRSRPLRQLSALPRGRRDRSRQGCDFAIVRENTEGPYVGEGGVLRRGTPQEVATQGSVNTRFGVERCVRYAFERARGPRAPEAHPGAQDQRAHLRGRPLVARRGRGRADFPGVEVDYHHVDAACIYLVEDPERYGIIVTDNLFGDILSDLAGAVTGGIGFAASANLNPAAHRGVALRAGPRRRPRHRRDRASEPAGRGLLGRADARTPRRRRRRTAHRARGGRL